MRADDPHSHIWTAETYHSGQRRGGALRVVSESAALLAGLIALAIAAMPPLGWAYRAAETLIAPDLAGTVSIGEARVLRVDPLQDGHDADDGGKAAELLARERAGRAVAEHEAFEMRLALAAAERAADEARWHLLAEQSGRQGVEQTLAALREELIRERSAREAAELATREALARKPKSWRLKKVETWIWPPSN